MSKYVRFERDALQHVGRDDKIEICRMNLQQTNLGGIQDEKKQCLCCAYA